jgi:GntR family transcriptional regulator / MocR family aminotransferase
MDVESGQQDHDGQAAEDATTEQRGESGCERAAAWPAAAAAQPRTLPAERRKVARGRTPATRIPGEAYTSPMTDPILYLDRGSELNLQAQIRQKLVEAIHLEVFKPGTRLPSSRRLAEQLGVARNTVVLACQQLVDEGLLNGRARSGLYVAQRSARPVATSSAMAARPGITGRWQQWLKARANPDSPRVTPDDARRYEYCFLDGQFDSSLFPVHEWREACRYALGSGEIGEWSSYSGDSDDSLLIEEIRSKILPNRGINARAEEILITVGAQQSLYLLAELLVDSSVSVGIEEPGYPEMRHLLNRRGAPILHQPIDHEGLLINSTLDGCRIIYVTPSHQAATGVTMSLERRRALLQKASERDMLVIEDDFDCESNYHGYPHPALRGMDRENRVIYVSCLSKVLAPGLRLGFMVAAPELIAEARKLRRLMVSQPPRNNQRAMAHFIRLGHYDAFTRHLHENFGKRWDALRSALNFYLPPWVEITPSHGGTVIWVQGSEDLDVARLVEEAARRGVLIEPVSNFYALSRRPGNCFRLGISGVPEDRIREGVARLATVVREFTAGAREHIDQCTGQRLLAADLQHRLAGATMVTTRVYGEPLTIQLHEDGRMSGCAGFADEDRDSGHWWVEGDRWVRQWSRWSYGEPASYAVVLDGDHIKFYLESGFIEDSLRFRSREMA